MFRGEDKLPCALWVRARRGRERTDRWEGCGGGGPTAGTCGCFLLALGSRRWGRHRDHSVEKDCQKVTLCRNLEIREGVLLTVWDRWSPEL